MMGPDYEAMLGTHAHEDADLPQPEKRGKPSRNKTPLQKRDENAKRCEIGWEGWRTPKYPPSTPSFTWIQYNQFPPIGGKERDYIAPPEDDITYKKR